MNQEEKAKVAKYASENGVAKAVRHFKDLNLKETSVRGWKRLYEKHEAGTSTCDGSVAPAKKRGRPPLLGVKADDMLQKLIVAMRERGVAVGTM